MPANLPGRLRIGLMLIGLVLVTLIGVGLYGLAIGPEHDPQGGVARPASTITSSTPTSRHQFDTTNGPSLIDTSDPVEYARSVAEVLFTWDTMSGLDPTQYAQQLLLGADPSGYEISGLVADLANYLPTPAVWQQLREYQTRQSIAIQVSVVPDSWKEIAESAGSQLREGTVAVTIEGTRHRTGIWYQQEYASEHPVAFTIFAGCPPSFERCHLLRLSRLDHPLR